jgi:nucleotide-binding universal stress UspA family protein
MAAHTRRIVVGYDGSDGARRALDAAADLVGYGSTLAVVTVQETPAAVAHETIDEARMRLLARHVPALYFEPAGEPAEAIAGTARRLDADLIVVGRGDRGSGNGIGSVGTDLVRDASCDVLVVR